MGGVAPDTNLDIARELRVLVEQLALGIGLDSGRACDLAASAEAQMRERLGGVEVYIPRRDRKAVRTAVRQEFNGSNRDELCARYKISRATFYRAIGNVSLEPAGGRPR